MNPAGWWSIDGVALHQAGRILELSAMSAAVVPYSISPVPKNKKSLDTLTLWAVLPQEVEAPGGIAPVRWMLLTTCPVESNRRSAVPCSARPPAARLFGLVSLRLTLLLARRLSRDTSNGADPVQAQYLSLNGPSSQYFQIPRTRILYYGKTPELPGP
jgi:hypothetical protein